jgi:hypothetical protein
VKHNKAFLNEDAITLFKVLLNEGATLGANFTGAIALEKEVRSNRKAEGRRVLKAGGAKRLGGA